VQLAERAVFPPGEAKEDWAIFRALSAVLGKTLPFDSLSELRAKLYAAVPHLAEIDRVPTPSAISSSDVGFAGALGSMPLTAPPGDFYLSNPIARASAIMAECSSMFSHPSAMAAE
jgi:NADH-quinone oxidoreductase subunit G